MVRSALVFDIVVAFELEGEAHKGITGHLDDLSFRRGIDGRDEDCPVRSATVHFCGFRHGECEQVDLARHSELHSLVVEKDYVMCRNSLYRKIPLRSNRLCSFAILTLCLGSPG